MTLEVLDGGPLTTVQDLGRPGLGRYGIPEGGAMDRRALRVANRLAGNGIGAAGLEFTLVGPRLRWRGRHPVEVAIVGDTAWRVTLEPGHVVDGGTLRGCARGYIAVRGGIAVPLVLGGRGTCLAGAFGGFRGRPLRRGDGLPVPPPRASPARRGGARLTDPSGPLAAAAEAREAALDLEGPRQDGAVRVVAVPGGEGAAVRLSSATWRVAEADRVGVRLAGPALHLAALGASRPMPPGALQVTGEGQPILLLRDHPTVGGYPLAGVVASADLDRCGQLRPGAEVRFEQVTLDVARAALGVRR